MTNEELDRLFDPQAQRCWICRYCIYDMESGYQCKKLRKPLGGNWEINSPNDCESYESSR